MTWSYMATHVLLVDTGNIYIFDPPPQLLSKLQRYIKMTLHILTPSTVSLFSISDLRSI